MKVLIIGAGLAGLTAARDLIQRGIEVEIIEARERVGGRIAPASNFLYPIDIGASWIHGVEGNPLTQVAHQLNLKLDITDNPNLTGSDSLEIYNEHGRLVDNKLQDSIRQQIDSMLESGRKNLTNHSADVSFEDMLQHYKATTEEEHHFLEWLKSGIEGWDSSPLAELSARNHFWEHDEPLFRGGDGFICNGFFTMVQQMSIGLPIHLGQIVNRISQFPNHIRVDTVQGRSFTADYVLCTLPLGVLKEDKIVWEPSLPSWKKQSIERLGFGTMNKIVVEFPHCFWNEKRDGIGFVSSKFRGEFGFFLNLKPQINRPVLMGFVAADFAKYVENWTNDQIISRVMQILSQIYGKIPDPVNFHITRWGSDPFSRGSYSFMKVHSTPQHVQDLGRPVGRIHFAGEATAKYPGYTHGAFMSAKREVERILESEKMRKMPSPIVTTNTQLIPVLTSKL